MFGFWLVVVIVVLGFVIMAAELGVPRRACRRSESHWRADTHLGSGLATVPGPSHYFAQAPWWYRALTGWWAGWRWVRL